MLLFVEPSPDISLAQRAVHLTEIATACPDSPGHVLSARDLGEGSREVAPESFEAWASFLSQLRDVFDEAGISNYVVDVESEYQTRLPELGVWLRRQYQEPVYRIAEPNRTIPPEVWLPETLEKSPRVPNFAPQGPDLTTARLRLSFATVEQLDDYYDAIVGTDLFDTLIWDGPESRADLHNFLLRGQREFLTGDHRPLQLSIVELETDRVIGGVSWRPQLLDPTNGDIGYALAPTAQGRGLGTEAVGCLVDYVFRERGAERVYAEVFVGNDRSRRLLEKLGFTQDGVLRANVVKRGKRLDEWLMTLTRCGWEARGGSV